MNITRRDFIKLSGAATGFLLTSSSFGLVKIPKAFADVDGKVGIETTSICCFCACGCGMLVTTENAGDALNDRVINVEGDPTHPVNEGALCSKALATRQTVDSQSWVTAADEASLVANYPEGAVISEWPKDKRVARVLYRGPNGPSGPRLRDWEVVSWTWALERIATLYDQSRTAGFQSLQSAGDGLEAMHVNRLTNVACLGGAAHDNQECYLLRKLMTGLGLVYIEHQARI